MIQNHFMVAFDFLTRLQNEQGNGYHIQNGGRIGA
jgi:hypothetical protein